MMISEQRVNFPLGVLPQTIATIVRDMERAAGYPAEYLASAMLVTTAVAMGNNWSIVVNEEWRERPLIYLAVVGNAGANKSHPVSFALRPLIDIDTLRVEAAKNQEPYTPPQRYIASDVTQEALVKLHDNNPRGLVLYVDELRAWVENFTRYSSGSQEQFWLSNFSRKPIIIDRKGESRPICIPDPLISVIGNVQPAVLKQFSVGDKSYNGFVDRMLFVVKSSPDKAYWSLDEVNKNHSQTWNYLITQLVESQEEVCVNFSPSALRGAHEWQRENTDLVNSCQNERLVGAYSKLEIYFVRFCLILHALKYYTQEGVRCDEVDYETVERAISLVEYFRQHRELAEDMLYPDKESELNKKPKMLLRALPDIFSRQQAVEVAQRLGISQSHSYKIIRELTDFYIGINEEGEYYKFETE